MRIAVITHVPFEGPAAIADWARSRGHALADVSAPLGVFPAPDAFDALVVMGGPMNVYQEQTHPWLAAEKRAIRAAVEAGRGVVGVCLGAQLLAVALGGSVRRNPEPEIGWFPVELTPAGRDSAVFGALPLRFTAGLWHGDTFELPADAARTLSSDVCANQAFELAGGRVMGWQFHLEWTRASLGALVDACGDELVPGPHVVAAEELLSADAPFGRDRALLDTLLDAWAARVVQAG